LENRQFIHSLSLNFVDVTININFAQSWSDHYRFFRWDHVQNSDDDYTMTTMTMMPWNFPKLVYGCSHTTDKTQISSLFGLTKAIATYIY